MIITLAYLLLLGSPSLGGINLKSLRRNCWSQVNIGLRVLTRPMPAKLPEIYRTLGTDYAERVLPSIIQVSTLYDLPH